MDKANGRFSSVMPFPVGLTCHVEQSKPAHTKGQATVGFRASGFGFKVRVLGFLTGSYRGCSNLAPTAHFHGA